MSETAEIAENQRKKKQRKLSHDELLRLLSVFEGELQARLVTKMIYSRYLQHLFNSLWDLFADLQKRGVFRDFDHETVFLDPWDPLSPHLKFHDEFDFDTFELDKITEKYLALVLSFTLVLSFRFVPYELRLLVMKCMLNVVKGVSRQNRYYAPAHQTS